MKKKVLLGMSGGVDSSVSAVLLQNKGYEVIGCTMILIDDKESTDQSIKDAKNVCKILGIEHYVFDFVKEFKELVINYFISEYTNGRTPNPCVVCNKYFKFGLLYDKAMELGCEFIATGHYAKIEYSEKYNQNILIKSNATNKDQTYFLYNIRKEQLDKILFPLAEYENKDEIRKIAEDNMLDVAKKKDSQEICFIKNDDYHDFLNNNMDKSLIKKGDMVLKNGEVIGKHTGLINYTVGQRKGLGIAYKEPLYVIGIEKENNKVIVGTLEDLYANELILENVNLMTQDSLENELECFVKIRYRAKEAKARIFKENNIIKVEFEEQQRAITDGQSAVFYDESGCVLGGGIIRKI